MLAAYVLAGYLLGSIPFGFLVARIWNLDIREHGSGNVGATNAFRILGVVPGVIVFALDFLKGTLAVYLGYWVGGDPVVILLLGVAVIFGHAYPIFLGFRGGKGAATGLGVLIGVAPDVFLLAAIFAAAVVSVTRYVSLASVTTPFLVTGLMFVFHKPLPYNVAAFLVAVFIAFRHIPNLKRLQEGKEPRLGEKT